MVPKTPNASYGGAALAQVSGFRPSRGRYPAAGIVPLGAAEDTPGPMGKTVADVALLDAVLCGAASECVRLYPVALDSRL